MTKNFSPSIKCQALIVLPESLIEFTLLSITDLRTAFDLLDRDQDGMVTPTELQFMLRNLGIEMSDELIDGLMKEASKTGKIEFYFMELENYKVHSGNPC